ncbi:UbiD family decarboxylase [Simkania negevensis]|uniref:UbiD family decarboxylase n=1 Tax=Simkania negevensis TaxID=83561 RepID=A0ABS3ASM8_9BACT|nr:UbiD family decarboxylase [Simkania negevensis]
MSLKACVADLERHGHLMRIADEVDPYLEMAEIHRRVYANGGPAILFERVKGSPFPAVSNLFGTPERGRFLFRKTYKKVEELLACKVDPIAALKSLWRKPHLPFTALTTLPKKVKRAPVLSCKTTISALPQIVSWPLDGGAYITLPQVLTFDQQNPSVMRSNLGMYRVQMSGGDLVKDREVGLHYQIHRGIGVHHAISKGRGEALRVAIFVGGHPAHTLAAVMPLPEGMSELMFAGALSGRRFRYALHNGYTVSAEADFCVVGYINPCEVKKEGPFGDHLGYYSLVHDFPLMHVEEVYHRPGAIWPFTVVGRPPQEDTMFGKVIHELTAPLVSLEIPGVKALHAVDATGVHPLMLAIGSERYLPYGEERIPQELLTQAHSILGFGQCSLAKYLFIAAHEDDPNLCVDDVGKFFSHLLERVDWTRDLHFVTQTTQDTLDYSGKGLNAGSKLVLAAAGNPKRTLASSILPFASLPTGFGDACMPLPGVVAIQAPPYRSDSVAKEEISSLCKALVHWEGRESSPLVVVVDDSCFVSKSLSNLLWVVFTRSDPAQDVEGVMSFVKDKHWGCEGPLVIDARMKPHHAPPLESDPAVVKKVESMGRKGGVLHGII